MCYSLAWGPEAMAGGSRHGGRAAHGQAFKQYRVGKANPSGGWVGEAIGRGSVCHQEGARPCGLKEVGF